MIIDKEEFNYNLEKRYIKKLPCYISTTTYRDNIFLNNLNNVILNLFVYKFNKVIYTRWFKYNDIRKVEMLTRDNCE